MDIRSRRLNRRTALTLGTLGLGGLLLPTGAAAPVRHSRPTPHAAHAAIDDTTEVPTGQASSGPVEVTLAGTTTPVAVDGATVPLSYEGVFPGPLLRLREGDNVRLTFVNRLDEMTNLHLHGLHISPAVDAPFVHLMPGEARLYEFTVPAGAAGTYWYHPHHHGTLDRQIRGGLVGPLLVTGPIDDLPELQAAQDHVLVFTALGGRGGRGGGAAAFLANGRQRETLTVSSPTLRLRLLNASADAFLRLAFEELTMHLVATDGGFIAAPVPLSEVLLAPGERAEVLVQASLPGSYALMRLPLGGRGGAAGGPEPLVTLEVPAAMAPSDLPVSLATVPPLDPAGAVATRRIVLDGGARIDGRRFDEGRIDLRAQLGSLEVWEIENASGQRHAFHLHSYSFQVLARNEVPEPYTAWRDVVGLAPGERVRLAVPFTDFGGTTVFHCHVAQHNDRGMMAVLEVV